MRNFFTLENVCSTITLSFGSLLLKLFWSGVSPFAPSRATALERHLTPKLGVIGLYPVVAKIHPQRDDIRQMWMTVIEQGVIMSASPGMFGLVDDELSLIHI